MNRIFRYSKNCFYSTHSKDSNRERPEKHVLYNIIDLYETLGDSSSKLTAEDPTKELLDENRNDERDTVCEAPETKTLSERSKLCQII